ncbi:MAG: portal protein, partial [Promethearchaeota archaeon]
MATDTNLIKDIEDMETEVWNKWSPLIDEMKEDFRFFLNDQWSDAEKELLTSKSRPHFSLSNLQAIVNVVTGYQRQNKLDIKYFPVEEGDVETASFFTDVVKKIMDNCNGDMEISRAFTNAAICGYGPTKLELDYSKDWINGQINLSWASPFKSFIDPYFEREDLEDVEYIISPLLILKKQLMSLFPNRIKEIKLMDGVERDTGLYGATGDDTFKVRGERIKICEVERKIWKEKTAIYDPATDDLQIFDNQDKETKEKLKYIKAMFPNLVLITKRVPEIEKIIKAGGNGVEDSKEILYRGAPSFSNKFFSNLPIFCTFTGAYHEYFELRLQGLIRSRKDAAREVNKLRSGLLFQIVTDATGGWIAEKGV